MTDLLVAERPRALVRPEPVIHSCLLFTPYRHNGALRFRTERKSFDSKAKAERAMLERIADAAGDAHMELTTIKVGLAAGTPSFTATTATQTAFSCTTTATDYNLCLLGYRIGYGVLSTAIGIPVNPYVLSAFTSAGTSTAATLTQTTGNVGAGTTNMSGAYNFTAEPTATKVYIDGGGQVQSGLDLLYDYPQASYPSTFLSGHSWVAIEHTPSGSTGPSTSGCMLVTRS